jgi:hypothetical protein
VGRGPPAELGQNGSGGSFFFFSFFYFLMFSFLLHFDSKLIQTIL